MDNKTTQKIPRVAATLRVVKHPWADFVVGFSWRIRCPFCNRFHWHGAGNVLQSPAPWCLGHRAAHCATEGPHGDYYLYDADPAATLATAAKARGKLREAAARGVGTAQKIIKKARAEIAQYPAPDPGARAVMEWAEAAS